MKRSALPILMLLIGATLTPALAQTKPDKNTPDDLLHVITQKRKPKLVMATFLGITGERVSPALNSQLQLPDGLGLVVTHVADESPAQEAGLQQHDVLHKLDDQLLVNFEQLAVLIRLHEPGDKVTLTVIRAGKSMPVEASLAEKELPELSRGPDKAHGMFMPNMTAPFGTGFQPLPKIEFDEDVIQVKPEGLFKPSSGRFVPNEQFKLRMVDGNHTIQLDRLKDDTAHLLVEDTEGNVIYDGPWQADVSAEQTELPKEVVDKIHQMISTPNFGDPIRIEADEIELLPPTPAPLADPGV